MWQTRTWGRGRWDEPRALEPTTHDDIGANDTLSIEDRGHDSPSSPMDTRDMHNAQHTPRKKNRPRSDENPKLRGAKRTLDLEHGDEDGSEKEYSGSSSDDDEGPASRRDSVVYPRRTGNSKRKNERAMRCLEREFIANAQEYEFGNMKLVKS